MTFAVQGSSANADAPCASLERHSIGLFHVEAPVPSTLAYMLHPIRRCAVERFAIREPAVESRVQQLELLTHNAGINVTHLKAGAKKQARLRAVARVLRVHTEASLFLQWTHSSFRTVT